VHDGLPPGLSTADNEAGWREALAKLALEIATSSTDTDQHGQTRTDRLARTLPDPAVPGVLGVLSPPRGAAKRHENLSR
jgi:hypothetical protein